MLRKKTTVKKAIEKKRSACQVDILNTEGKIVGNMDLPEQIFGAKVNPQLMAQAVRVYLANQRQGTQFTKSRGEVVASTAKIWRQKGTGRARHGARSAPIFVGGGVAHGPKPRDFSLKMPEKMRRKALFSALTEKLNEKAILVVKGIEEVKPKTKEVAKILSNFKITSKLLLILPDKKENLIKAARNIDQVSLIPAASLNTYLVLNHQKLLFLPDSFSVLAQTFLGQSQEKTVKTARKKEVKQ